MLDLRKEYVFELNKDIVIHSIPELDKYWVFNVNSGDHYEINESAYFLISHVDGKTNLENITSSFYDEYSVGTSIAENDVSEIIKQFLDSNIIRRR